MGERSWVFRLEASSNAKVLKRFLKENDERILYKESRHIEECNVMESWVDSVGSRVYCWTGVVNDPKKQGGGKMIRLPDLFYLILTHVHSRPLPRFNLDDSACGRPLSCWSNIDPKPASFFLVGKNT